MVENYQAKFSSADLVAQANSFRSALQASGWAARLERGRHAELAYIFSSTLCVVRLTQKSLGAQSFQEHLVPSTSTTREPTEELLRSRLRDEERRAVLLSQHQQNCSFPVLTQAEMEFAQTIAEPLIANPTTSQTVLERFRGVLENLGSRLGVLEQANTTSTSEAEAEQGPSLDGGAATTSGAASAGAGCFYAVTK